LENSELSPPHFHLTFLVLAGTKGMEKWWQPLAGIEERSRRGVAKEAEEEEKEQQERK
jgi:hypothetical protein